MKKFFLLLTTLVLGFGQLFADEVTFSASELRESLLPSGNTNVSLPYTWKVSPYHVSVTIAKKDGTTGTLGIAAPANLTNCTLTINIAGAGTLDGVSVTAPTGVNALDASSGTYNNGTWTPEGATHSVTFTPTGNFRMSSLTVNYTPDETVNPDVPVDPNAPIKATQTDNISSYEGNDPYVYDATAYKYYALNDQGKYEEYGVFNKVSTLKSEGLKDSELDYIQTTSANAYFKTGYIPKTNTRVIAKALVGSRGQGGNWRALFGTGYYQDGWRDRFCLFTNTNNDFIAINVNNEVLGAAIYDRIANYELDAATGLGKVYDADGSTVLRTIVGEPKSDDCLTEMYILAQNKTVPGEGEIVDCKNPTVTLFGMQIYEGETLVKNYVPFVNAEGVVGLKETVSDEFIAPSGGDVQSGSVTSYEGKIVRLLTDNHVYQFTGGTWVDKGAMTMKELASTDYKDMRTWKTNDNHTGVFDGKITYTEEGNNFINPYVGTGGHEPLMTKIDVNKGDDYCFSFKASHPKYWSWGGQDHMVHASVWNGYDLGTSGTYRYIGDDNNNILASFAFQYQTEVTDLPVVMDFTAAQTTETLIIQFGDGEDGEHGFWWRFNDVKVAKYVYPVAYQEIIAADPNKYTPLEYIENKSAARENAYTLPYSPVTNTQIDIKFKVNDTSTGWSAIFCGRNKDAGTGISLYMNGNDRAHFGYFTGGTRGEGDNFADFRLNTVYNVIADVTKLQWSTDDGATWNEKGTGNSVTNATSRNLSLFANPENDNPMRGPIYYCKISESGKVIYNFKPVIRHDGVFGFYDDASQTFVMPAQGKLDGYGYKKLEDQAYITFNQDLRIVVVGTTAQFLPDAQNLDGATYTWTSSDESKATVAADGTVTGKAAGKVTITVTTDADQGWTASYELTVSEPNYVRRDANGVGYAIITGGNGWGDSPLSALLDNNADTKFGCSNSGDAWAIMIASEPVAVQQYSFVTGADTYGYPGRNPVSWKLEGSNDNQTWTVIDEQVKSYKLQAKNKEEFEFFVNGTETYKFFKFSATQLGDGFQMGEFWINAQAHNYAENAELRVEATCTKDGQVVYECDDCHALLSKPIEKAPHTYVDGVCKVCSAKIAEVTLLPTRGGDNTPYYAKFRYAEGVSDAEYVDIEEGWNTVDFNDSEWGELMMPLGSFGPYHTRWIGEYNTFWFRRDFFIEDPSVIAKLTFKAVHDDDYTVFVNGTKVVHENGWTDGENDWRIIDVDPSLLVAGQNVLAVYVEQNFGGAYCDFGLEAKVAAPVAVGETGYATFVAPFDVDFTGADVTAHAATLNGNYVKLSDPVTKVPAGEAVIVKANEGTYRVPVTTDAVNNIANELLASDGVTADGTQYILANMDSKAGFAQATPASVIPAGKGYLVIAGGSEVKAFYPFEETETAIKSLTPALSEGEGAIYNMAGQRISKLQKGVNIVSGRKVLY
ncbi:MAG: Ig-like domain-containing protein [Bacteroidaceae bacterium]|nr:Ig-like domain-containing protein [Bacteroidaceae bacterium]